MRVVSLVLALGAVACGYGGQGAAVGEDDPGRRPASRAAPAQPVSGACRIAEPSAPVLPGTAGCTAGSGQASAALTAVQNTGAPGVQAR